MLFPMHFGRSVLKFTVFLNLEAQGLKIVLTIEAGTTLIMEWRENSGGARGPESGPLSNMSEVNHSESEALDFICVNQIPKRN